MHDEITHFRIVDGFTRFGLPRGVGGGVIGEDADNIELVQIFEG